MTLLTADTWPIAASLLNLGSADASAADWPERARATLREVADAGFTDVDLTDSWVKPGELTDSQLDELAAALADTGTRFASLSAIRRSVIDAEHGDAYLAYSHATLEAAARLGIGTVSFGLHQALTPEQSKLLWFWLRPGHRDADDPTLRALAVSRFQELGKHAAELGILMSLEMYEHTYLGTGASGARLVEEIGLPNVGLNPDIGNLVRLHEPIEDWRDLLATTLPYTNYWHVKNYMRDEDLDSGVVTAFPTYMETGIINYREGIKMAIAAGFQGVICTENYGGDGLSITAANRDYLRGRVLPRTTDYALGTSKVQQLGGPQ